MGFRIANRMARERALAVVLSVVFLSAACAVREVPMAPVVSLPAASTPVPGELYRETGIASWYGRELHGRKTASGETFDMFGISAAHRILPLGATIRVTNLENFKSIQVRVNDRGPFVGNRVLDLSYGAAKELGFVAQGTMRVKIETLDVIQDSAHYTVQAAIFSEEENARMLKDRLSKKYEVITIVPFETNVSRLYRVRIGSYATEERAEVIAGKLTLEGLEPIVIRKDQRNGGKTE